MSSELCLESNLCVVGPGLNRNLWYVHTSQDVSVIKTPKYSTQVSHFYDFNIYGDGGVITWKPIELLSEAINKFLGQC